METYTTVGADFEIHLNSTTFSQLTKPTRHVRKASGIILTIAARVSNPSQKQQISMSPSQTSFADALTVPQLAQACSAAVKLAPYRKSTGLKVLREVSKQISICMLASVQGYTLQLEESEQPSLLEASTLLQSTKLSCLRVKVMAGTGKKRDSSGYPAKLAQFMTQMSRCLKTVTHLTLEVHFHRGGLKQATAASSFLAPLARAFPDLQHLCLGGDIALPLLQKFAASCKKLTCLEVLQPGIPHANLYNLHQLLPSLTCVRLQQSPDPTSFKAKFDNYPEDVFLAACKLPFVTTLDIPSLSVSKEAWNAIPPGLLKLRIDTFGSYIEMDENPSLESASQDCKVHHGLQHLSLTVPESDIPAPLLAAVLRLAPGVKELTLGSAEAAEVAAFTSMSRSSKSDCKPARGKNGSSAVSCMCDSSFNDAIMLLDQRLKAGLTITERVTDTQRRLKQLALHLHWIDEDSELLYSDTIEDQAAVSICTFLDALPPCTSFTQLALTILPFHSDADRRSVGSSCSESESMSQDNEDACEQAATQARAKSLTQGLMMVKNGKESEIQQHHVGEQQAGPANDFSASDAALLNGEGGDNGQDVEFSIPRSIARAFPTLQGLHLSVGVDLECTVKDLGRSRALESLTLSHHKQMRSDLVGDLCKAMPLLRELGLFKCRLVDNSHAEAIRASADAIQKWLVDVWVTDNRPKKKVYGPL